MLGQDGLSYAPVDDTTLPAVRRQIAGWNGESGGFDWDWRTVGEYLDRLDRGIAVNACYLVPHGIGPHARDGLGRPAPRTPPS